MTGLEVISERATIEFFIGYYLRTGGTKKVFRSDI